jgi:hypothetical protein
VILKKMRTQCAVAIIAVVVLFSVLMVVPTVMSMSDGDYTYLRFTGNVTELWNQSHEGASWISASVVSDLDGDAKEDVLVLTSANNEATNTTTGTVIAKRGCNGTQLWNVSATGGPSGDGIYALPAGDLDGDGKEDVLVQMAEYNETKNTTTKTVIAKRGCNGTQLWEESVSGSSSVISASQAGDLDGDGKEDVLVQMAEYNETTNTTTKTVIAKRGCNGTQLWEENGTVKGLELWIFDVALPAGDLDGDGKADVLVHMSEYNDTIQTWTGTVIAKCGCNGTHLWEESVAGSILATQAGDLDGDGKEDVLVHISEHNETMQTWIDTAIAKCGCNGTHLWEESVAGSISVTQAGDLDGDGKEDVLVEMSEFTETMCTQTVIAKRGCNGTHLWEESSAKLAMCPTGDLDGDGKEDVLVLVWNDSADTTNKTVIAKRGCNGTHLWEESGTWIIDVVQIGDLAGNGTDDVIVKKIELKMATNTTKETVIAKRGYDGFQLWNESVSGTCLPGLSTSLAGDLDGDGKEDVIVNQRECDEAMNITTAIAKRGYDGTHLWMAESDGYIEVTTRVIEKPGCPGQSRAADFNGDGIANVLLVSCDSVYAV